MHYINSSSKRTGKQAEYRGTCTGSDIPKVDGARYTQGDKEPCVRPGGRGNPVAEAATRHPVQASARSAEHLALRINS